MPSRPRTSPPRRSCRHPLRRRQRPPTIRRSSRRRVEAGMGKGTQALRKVAVTGAVQPPPAGNAQHNVAVAGASGRMGHMLIEAISDAADCRLAGALDIASSPAIGNDAAAFLGHASGVPVTADIGTGLQHAQVLIDFTRPEGTLAHLRACRERGLKMVIGTTGFSEAQKAEITDAARDIAIVMAPNMSVGVN